MRRLPKIEELPEVHENLTERIVYTVIQNIKALTPPKVPTPYFTNDTELRNKIIEKIKSEVHPDLWENIDYTMLAKRYEEHPELVRDLKFVYLVKIQYVPEYSITSPGSGTLEENIWGTYFKRVIEPERALEYILRLAHSEGTMLKPEEIEAITVLPNIPLPVLTAYEEEQVDLDEELEALPEY